MKLNYTKIQRDKWKRLILNNNQYELQNKLNETNTLQERRKHMKVTVGGSYHEPGWTAVCNLIRKLKEAGHEVLAPGDEWIPINKDDSFIRFKGEKNRSIAELQDGFFDKMDLSDAYIICNPNSYEGMAVSVEFGYACCSILNKTSNLKQIFFMEKPLGYELFKGNPNISEEEFRHAVLGNPKFKNELGYYRKFLNNSKPEINYGSISDFYCDLRDFFVKVLVLEKMGGITIGLDSILMHKKEDIDRE